MIVLADADQAVPLARALLAGGIDVMEITLRSEAGLKSIEAVAREVPQMQVGAGTVTRADEVRRVQEAGARFALSPGMTDALAEVVKQARMPFVPGVMTPGAVMRARSRLFPAQTLPRRAGRRTRHAQGPGVAFRGAAFLPDGRRDPGEPGGSFSRCRM